MAKFKGKYLGGLRMETANELGEKMINDAPKSSNGKGEYFSPTDLLSNALATCMMALMGVWADKKGVSLEGVTWEVEKMMLSTPRRIGEVIVIFYFPKALNLDEKAQEALQRYAKNCPVARSVHPDLIQNATFVFDHEG